MNDGLHTHGTFRSRQNKIRRPLRPMAHLMLVQVLVLPPLLPLLLLPGIVRCSAPMLSAGIPSTPSAVLNVFLSDLPTHVSRFLPPPHLMIFGIPTNRPACSNLVAAHANRGVADVAAASRLLAQAADSLRRLMQGHSPPSSWEVFSATKESASRNRGESKLRVKTLSRFRGDTT